MRLRSKRSALLLASTVVFFIVLASESPFHPWAMFSSDVTRSVMAGALTGIFETLCMYPLENIKTQQQLDSRPLLDLLRRTLDIHGIAGLYRGMSPILIGAIPTQAVRWGSYTAVCNWRGCVSITDVFIAGLISGCFVAVATGIPMESMKTHMIHTLHTPPPASPASPFSPLPGFSGMKTPSPPPPFSPSSPGFSLSSLPFKGWAPTIAKKVLNQAIRFPVHSMAFRLICGSETCSGSKHPFLSFVAGAVAGLSSILMTQPIDVVKTRMQGIGSERYGHSIQCFYLLLKEEGGSVFFDGIIPRSVRVALGAGLTFSVFPLFKALLTAEMGLTVSPSGNHS